MPTRILILRGKVQLIAQLEVINLPGEAHHVVRNELVGSLTAQNVRLHLMEIQHQIRAEAHPVQLLGRILPRGCDPRRVDLLKVRVSLAPEGRAPAFVQAVNAPVLFLQPLPEGGFAGRAIAQILMAVAQLIIHLPAHHMRVRSKVPGIGGDKAADMRTVLRIGLTIVVTAAEIMPLQVGVQGLDFRGFLNDPRGRSRAGCAKNAVDPLIGHQCDDLIQFFKMEFAFPGLPLGPGKLRHPHDRNAHFTHHACIRLPAFPRPVLRIIVNTESIPHPKSLLHHSLPQKILNNQGGMALPCLL